MLPAKHRLIIGIATGILMFISGSIGGTPSVPVDTNTTSSSTSEVVQLAKSANTDKRKAIESASKKSAKIADASTDNTEEVVRAYFEDIPVMIEVARCESHYRQFDEDGKIHRGVANNLDVGIMQVNEYYHLEDSKKLGYDIYTVDGNLAYGRRLYEKQGTAPWSASKPCWGKTIAAKNAELALSK